MKLSQLQRALAEEFGAAYAGVLLEQHWLPQLGQTGAAALAAGVEPRRVWLALCQEFEIPKQRWHGRGLVDPPV